MLSRVNPDWPTYRVGLFSNMFHAWRSFRHVHVAYGWMYLKREVRQLWRYVRFGRWHELRMHLNGFLCEPEPFPEGAKRCGSGWTRNRARRSMARAIPRAGKRLYREPDGAMPAWADLVRPAGLATPPESSHDMWKRPIAAPNDEAR